MDDGIAREFKNIESLIKNNYINLSQADKRIEEKIDNVFQSHQKDHDNLIRTEERMKTVEEELGEFKVDEKTEGQKISVRVDDVAKDVKDMSLSYGKILGMITGASIFTGGIIFLLLKIFGGN